VLPLFIVGFGYEFRIIAKTKEMLIDFKKNPTVIPALVTFKQSFGSVTANELTCKFHKNTVCHIFLLSYESRIVSVQQKWEYIFDDFRHRHMV